MKKVLLYGCGKNAQTYVDKIIEGGYQVIAFIDKKKTGSYKGIIIDGLDNIYKYSYDEICRGQAFL